MSLVRKKRGTSQVHHSIVYKLVTRNTEECFFTGCQFWQKSKLRKAKLDFYRKYKFSVSFLPPSKHIRCACKPKQNKNRFYFVEKLRHKIPKSRTEFRKQQIPRLLLFIKQEKSLFLLLLFLNNIFSLVKRH